MTNKDTIRNLCTAVASSFYPDMAVVETTASTMGLNPDDEAVRKDPLVFRCVVLLVRGYIEGSRSENGISVSVRSEEAIKQSLLLWCGQYDLDPEQELGDFVRKIQDGSSMW